LEDEPPPELFEAVFEELLELELVLALLPNTDCKAD
jgi:hypothetical protein